MLKKVSALIILTVSITTALYGCGSNLSGQNPSATVQTQAPGTTGEKVENTADKNTQNTDNPAGNATEKPVAPEKNPPGDIPDSQVFVKYASASGGYEMQVPEGWGRTENGNDVSFVDKFDGIQVKISDTTDAFSVDNITKNQVATLKKSGRAVNVKDVKEVNLSGGTAVLVSYDSNSEPDPVTSKQIRLENESIFFYKNGKIAEMVLWAPLGADNVDQWNLISNSFNWR